MSPLNVHAAALPPNPNEPQSQWRDVLAASTRDLFESAFEYATIGMALVGLDGKFLRVNRALCQFIGYSDEELITLGIEDVTHPTDMPNDLASQAQLLAGDQENYQLEKRYFHQSGAEVWGHLSVSLVRNLHGQPLFFIRQVQDITERKVAEEKWRVVFARFAKLVENFQGGLLMEDENGNVFMMNQTLCDMFGIMLSAESMRGQASADIPIKKVAEPAYFVSRLHVVAAKGVPVTGERILMRDGRVLERDYTPIHDNHTPLGHLWLYRDITDRVRAFARIEEHAQNLQVANSELERIALTDALTGAHNRRAFMSRLEEEITESVANATPLSLLMTDIDYFKMYNDDYGHPAGDEILRQVTWILQHYTRVSDYVARYGGEEFAILLPGADYQTSLEVAERLRRAVAEFSWMERPLTASFGITTITEFDPDTSPDILGEALIAVADSALYQAKRVGRNRVVHAYDF